MRAADILRHLDAGTLWPTGCGLELEPAYARALEVRARRVARGEKPVGYKVGFTNRTIWPRYEVYAPIWGTVYEGTLAHCALEGSLSLARTCQPRLEPECVFGMARTPPRGASLDELLASVDWIAPGFEIVQSHLPNWKFTAADTVADGSLHARLLVGPRVSATTVATNAEAFGARLAAARVVLRKADEEVDSGVGANVLDSPLHALAHFLDELRACPGAPDLLPGDVVTTGTWTDAWPVQPGETWGAQFDDVLGSLTVRFTA